VGAVEVLRGMRMPANDIYYFQSTANGGRIIKNTPPRPELGPYIVLTAKMRESMTGSPSFWKIDKEGLVYMEAEEANLLKSGKQVRVPRPHVWPYCVTAVISSLVTYLVTKWVW
jgi:hypothetical protein